MITKEEIIENNKLIANFLGWKNKGMKNLEFWERFHNDKCVATKECKFHSSWDWLIPTLNKILPICCELDEMERYWIITDQIPSITDTFEAVVNFIKWYNENKKTS